MPRVRNGLVAFAILASQPGHAEDLDAPDPTRKETPQGYVYENGGFTLMLGGGLLFDYNNYLQDDDSEDQLELNKEGGIRDLRGLASGQTPWDRLSYTVGYMLDVSRNSWRFRQTGFKVQIPEAGGFLFLGRTKEGFSTNKLMVGYYGWFNERSAANDAFIPILNDGVRWTAAAFGGHLVYNVGAFADPLGEEETYNRNDHVFAGRAVWLPFGPDAGSRVLHLAGDARYGAANDGSLVFRSKPESFFAQQNAVDTGMFEASHVTTLGVEAYYVDGPFSSGTEYFFNQVSSDAANDPFFHGGEIFAAYLFTGETHPYNPNTGVFTAVQPETSVFDGGLGAIELAARLSYVDLDSELIEGGRFARVTALLNWYVNDTLRLEAAYGYGVLDREGITGATHFFQTRFQLSIR